MIEAGLTYHGLYPKDGCLAVQYAESQDLPLVAQAPSTSDSSIEKTNKEHRYDIVHYDRFAKSIMKAHGHGFHDRKKIPKCFFRLVRQLYHSNSYTGHKDVDE